MPITVLPGTGQGLNPLIEALVKKQQLELQQQEVDQQKELLKIRQGQFEMDQAQRKAEEEAAMLVLESIGRNLGVNPSAAPELLQGLQQQRALESEVEFREAQITNFDTQAALERRRLALQERIAATEDANEQARLAFEERALAAQIDAGNRELASRELTSVLNIAASLRITNPAEALQRFYGTDDINVVRSELANEAELPPEERRQRRLTRFLTGMEMETEAQNELNQALFVENVDPQQFVDDLFAREDAEDGDKANIFYALSQIYPDLRVPEVASPTLRQRLVALFRNFSFLRPPPQGFPQGS